MTLITNVARPTTDTVAGTAKLEESALQLQGMFARQLFAAMRATVPTGGALDGGAGGEMFTSLFDEQLADELPSHWRHDMTTRMVTQLGQVNGSGPEGDTR